MRRQVQTAAVLVGLTAAACTQGRTPFNDPDALVVAMYSGFTEQVVAAAEPWQQTHREVHLSLAPYQPNDFAQAMIPRLLTGADVPDVMVVDAAFVESAARGKSLEDLSAAPYSAGKLLEGVPAAALGPVRIGGALVAVPMDAAPTVLFYRKDLLDQAGVTEAELTSSWEGFVAACAKLRARSRTYCVARVSDLAEAVLRSDLPDGQDLYFSAAGEPLADEPRFARAFALARAAREAHIEAGPAPGTDPWVELFRRGYFAVQFGGPTMVRRLAAMSPKTAGLWRSAKLPGGARLPGIGAYCAVSSRGARKDRAWEFVQKVCLDKHAQLQAWRVGRALPSLPAAAAAPALEEPVPFLGDQVVGPAWRAAAAALPVPGHDRLDAFARDALLAQLDYVVEDGKDFQKAMADARARVRRQMERVRR